MAKVIVCPGCESELTEATSRFKIVNNHQFKMKCGICATGWVASAEDFYDRKPEEEPVGQTDS